MKQAKQTWTNLLNPKLSYDYVVHAAVDVVPSVNFVIPIDGEKKVNYKEEMTKLSVEEDGTVLQIIML